jgi:hypothetical protein
MMTFSRYGCGLGLVLGAAACDQGTPGADAEGAPVTPDSTSTESRVATDGWITTGPWSGAGFTATDPGAATITPECANDMGCMPPYTGNTFCMQGTVTGRADYTGFAMLGWNVNQAPGGDPMTWPVPDTGGVLVTVVNKPASTALRVQLQGTDPHSGADRWCAPLVSGKLIPWSAFKTNCWAGGTPQDPLTLGTMIQQGSVIVPGLTRDLPFDVCVTDIQVQ